MAACGLDFGTSNTTLGTLRSGRPALERLEGGAVTVPSAIFFPRAGEPAVGRAAIAAYVEGAQGRLMRGLKSVLGSSLLEETTPVGRARISFRAVIARYLAIVKERAEAEGRADLTRVVHGRPVHFVDGDPEGDRRAEAALEEIARAVGFREVSFQYEPIAAALDYESGIDREEVALIADIGGGTSDFSVVRLSPERHARADRAGDILSNDGVRIGGTDFDRFLSLGGVMPLLGFGSPMKRPGLDVPSAYFHDLATWSSINRLYDGRTLREIQGLRREVARPDLLERLATVIEMERGHTLAMAVEDAKIALSGEGTARIDLGWVEPDLAAPLTRDDLERHTAEQARRIGARIAACLAGAGLRDGALDALFLTGGSTRLPHVRAAILAAAPGARVVEGDTFGSVGTGLTIEAARRYG
ncbi:MAG: Hsp70 family protein [Methylobacterium frigidaeris]